MPEIEGFRIKNYRSLQDVKMGKLFSNRQEKPLSSITTVIGKNGSGKSSLLDAFGFLADCLKVGVEEACYSKVRGGFKKIRSNGITDPIEFEIYYKEDRISQPITYEVSIDLDKKERPYVKSERLRQRRKGSETRGWPYSFLNLNEGKGLVWKGDALSSEREEGDYAKKLLKLMKDVQAGVGQESKEAEVIELEDKRKFGIATLGSLKQHPRISAFRKFIEGWYLSYFTPDAARSLPLAGPQKHLNIHGDNLSNVVQFMEREHPKRFKSILRPISDKIPGIDSIETEVSSDGRLLLKFNDKVFDDGFYSQQMSDGTLKIFAYLLLMEDPTPPPFMCIEEPENGLYHKLLEILAHELREHATGRKGGSQIFITTHQPYFVDALKPEEVWILEKGQDGFSHIKRASDIELVKNLVEEELPLGGLWYSDYLDAR